MTPEPASPAPRRWRRYYVVVIIIEVIVVALLFVLGEVYS